VNRVGPSYGIGTSRLGSARESASGRSDLLRGQGGGATFRPRGCAPASSKVGAHTIVRRPERRLAWCLGG